jgi:tetratricopeptide (TPR) repeat protein
VVPLAVAKSPGDWLIAAATSATLAPGNYIFTAGGAASAVVLADPPAELSPDQTEARQIALASTAMLRGDAVGAEQIARDWITATPNSPNAREALGDALVAGGKSNDAIKAYNEALLRTTPSDQPPSSLYAKAAALRQKAMMAMPTAPGTATSADDVAYYKIVDEADALVASGDYARAVGTYNRARSYYGSKKLTLGLEELDRKTAYSRAQQNRPKTAPATKPTPH